jgi:hypothetical protein
MKTAGIVFVIAVAAWLGGCSRRGARAEFPELRVPVGCASEILMSGCDVRARVPKCERVRVTYRAGCEEIVVPKSQHE